MKNIGIAGIGSWACGLARVLSDNGHNVQMWSISQKECDMINNLHEQQEKLPGIILPKNVIATNDLQDICCQKDIIIMAVPSIFVRDTAQKIKKYIKNNQIITCVSKGIEETSLATLSTQIFEEIPNAEITVLAGPSHAEEVAKRIPTAVVVGAKSQDIGKFIQHTFMNEYFRVYTSQDIIGIEVSGALKNVIALAAGISDGLGGGDNTKAALITRGINEIIKIGTAVGGKSETFYGLTGIGDLIVTCASKYSRNRNAGFLIGQGHTYQEAMEKVKMIVEGVYSAKAAKNLALKYNLNVPIITEVCNVLFNGKNPKVALKELMQREGKNEFY